MSKRKADENIHWTGYSRSHFNRLARAEHESLSKQVELAISLNRNTDVNETQPSTSNASAKNYSDSDSDDELYYPSDCSEVSNINSSTSDDEDECETSCVKPSLKTDLASYVARRGVASSHVNEFLNILHKYKDNPNLETLPRSHDSLMKTSKKKINVRSIPTKPNSKTGPTAFGSLYYRGIAVALNKRKELIKDLDCIVLDIGIDGANKYVSSKLTIWPIIGDVANSSNIRPFFIACYQGQGKANNSDDLFDEFLLEAQTLMVNGIELSIDGELIKKSVSIRMFVLDSVGRADICKIMAHSSYQGCPMCKFTEKTAESQKKKRSQKKLINESEQIDEDELEDVWQGKVIYSEKMGFSLRTDETFTSRLHPEHHKPEYRCAQSALEAMGFQMISQFPLDPMHIIDLGVVLYTLLLMIKLKFIDLDKISEQIISFKNFRPGDFARDIRSFEYLHKFKATELRQFLLYGSIVFLKGLVPDYLYDHWLLLHVAVRLLSSPSLTSDNIDTAEALLKEFVERYPLIYGSNSVTYKLSSYFSMDKFSQSQKTFASSSLTTFSKNSIIFRPSPSTTYGPLPKRNCVPATSGSNICETADRSKQLFLVPVKDPLINNSAGFVKKPILLKLNKQTNAYSIVSHDANVSSFTDSLGVRPYQAGNDTKFTPTIQKSLSHFPLVSPSCSALQFSSLREKVPVTQKKVTIKTKNKKSIIASDPVQTKKLPTVSAIQKCVPPTKNLNLTVNTEFTTSIDSQPRTIVSKVMNQTVTDSADSMLQNRSDTFSSGGVKELSFSELGIPDDSRVLKKVTIDTTKLIPSNSSSPYSSEENRSNMKPTATKTSKAQIEIENTYFDGTDRSDDRQWLDNFGDDLSAPIYREGKENEYTQRMERIEAKQDVSTKQMSQVLVAVTKLSKSFRKYAMCLDDENDEVKTILPIRRFEKIDELQNKYYYEEGFRKKLMIYLNGFKGARKPKSFCSVMKKVISDDVLLRFNLKGVKNKLAFEDCFIHDAIQELYKPMDADEYEELMRKTLTKAKNRHHNKAYRSKNKNSEK